MTALISVSLLKSGVDEPDQFGDYAFMAILSSYG
jgi:hypothetical protein